MAEFNYKLLLELRWKKGWTRRELMFKLHEIGVSITEGSIENWETNVSTPDAEKVVPLAKLLGTTAEALVK
mgnify:FL=1